MPSTLQSTATALRQAEPSTARWSARSAESPSARKRSALGQGDATTGFIRGASPASGLHGRHRAAQYAESTHTAPTRRPAAATAPQRRARADADNGAGTTDGAASTRAPRATWTSSGGLTHQPWPAETWAGPPTWTTPNHRRALRPTGAAPAGALRREATPDTHGCQHRPTAGDDTADTGSTGTAWTGLGTRQPVGPAGRIAPRPAGRGPGIPFRSARDA